MRSLIDSCFWSDSEIEKQSSGVKLVALWLMTNSSTTALGTSSASPKRFAFETGLPEEALAKCLKALPKPFVQIGDVIFIRNYIRHQFGHGDSLLRNNFFVRLRREFEAIRDPKLQQAILQEYPVLASPSKGLPRGLQARGREGKVQEGESEGGKKRPGTQNEVLEFCRSINLPVSDADYFWHKWQGNGFRNNKSPMRDWQAVIRSWKDAGHCPSQKHHAINSRNNPESARNRGTANEGRAGQYAGVGKIRAVPNPNGSTARADETGSG